MTASDFNIETLNSEILVSLIVPVFNAELYRETCITSIQSQKFRNIEIILVNDGSTDSSGDIIDKFSRIDPRIKVIHKNNAGVSAARNSGLALARGDYISFVDADDWLSPHFVEFFLREAINNDADFVLSKNTLPSPTSDYPMENVTEIWTRTKAINELMYAEITIGCWNKIYKRSVIYDNEIDFDLRFFMGEGLNFITKVADKSSKIVVISSKLYYYRRDNNKSATGDLTIKKLKNAIAAIDNISLTLGKTEKSTQVAVSYHRWHTVFFFLVVFREQGCPRDEEDFYRGCRSYIRNNSFPLLVGADVSRKRRALLLANLLSPDLAVWAFRVLWKS